MAQITASNHITIDFSYDKWRLIQQNDGEDPKLIAEVQPETDFRYNKYFATTRYLPDEGQIAREQISQVVLGWSYETDAWQLGMTLSPQLAAQRNSRWCELVRFVDPDLSVYEHDAKTVGQALADVLKKPFRDVPPATVPTPKPIPLPELPLSVGIWTLDRVMSTEGLTSHEGEIHLIRSKSWINNKLRKIAWYALWVVLYLWVSIATMTSTLALPNAGTLLPDPKVLPYLGIGVAVLLVGLIVQQIWHIRTQPDNIIVNPYERSIIARRGRHMRWKISANGIQSVYASEVIKKREKKPATYHSELNLHLVNGSFQPILIEDEKIDDATLPNVDDMHNKNSGEGVTPLDSHTVTTCLQAFALHMADCLGDLPAWYDLRYK
jgi:hypothetical protein